MAAITVTRQQITSATTRAGLDPDEVTVTSDYSGRGMYGDRCLAVTLHRDYAFLLAAALTLVLTEDEDDDGGAAIDLGERARTDNMGTDTILYFPGVTLTD